MAPGEKGKAAVVGRALTGKGQTPGPPPGRRGRRSYGLIGGGCAALDGGVFALLHNMGLGVYGANAISVHCGILCSFFLNRRFNFRRTDRREAASPGSMGWGCWVCCCPRGCCGRERKSCACRPSGQREGQWRWWPPFSLS